jgi:hypothetical protein
MSSYATVTDEGVNYRQIAEKLTSMGHKMNHSTARNYVLRTMHKILSEINEKWNLNIPYNKFDDITKSSLFQSAISDILHDIYVRNGSTTNGKD